MLAVQHTENVNIIQYLCNTFKNTIDINKTNEFGYTALMVAAHYNANIEILLYLYNIFKDVINVNKL